MGNLFLLTDSFPYGKGEDFISNEIDMLSKAFQHIYIIPSGIMCDTTKVRKVPSNATVIEPVYSENLYTTTNPTKLERIKWSIRYMLPWLVKCLLCSIFYQELWYLLKTKKLHIKKVLQVVRNLSPCLKNINHYKKRIHSDMFNSDYNVSYSFWFDSSQYMFQKCMRMNKIEAPLKRVSRGHRHDIYIEESKSKYLPFRNIYFSYIDNLYISTLDGYEYMKKNYPKNIEKIKLSYLGTKDRGFRNMNNEGIFRIVSCSFASPVKRLDLIIEALSKLKTTREVEWVYFGDGLLFDQLTQLAKEKLSGKVKYIFKGYTSNEEMLEYYKEHDIHVFINVSTSEGLPVSIQEAISFAIPIIATDVGSTREAVINRFNGYLIEKDFDIEKLTHCIDIIAKLGQDDFSRYSKNSRKLWEENFNAENVYSRYIKEICKTDI